STTGYSALGQIGTTTFANGVVTVNAYDPLKLYRLTNRATCLFSCTGSAGLSTTTAGLSATSTILVVAGGGGGGVGSGSGARGGRRWRLYRHHHDVCEFNFTFDHCRLGRSWRRERNKPGKQWRKFIDRLSLCRDRRRRRRIGCSGR